MSDYWFRPKQRGIGAGVPTNWKGWALVIAYIGAIVSIPSAFELALGHEGTLVDRAIALAAISVPFLYVARKKTEGGWSWRWRKRGDDFDDDQRR